MKTTVAMIGAFDTKGAEYRYLRERLVAAGHDVFAIDTGVFDADPGFPVDVDTARLAGAAGEDLHALREANDRGRAMRAIAEGGARLVPALHAEGCFDGIIGMGGTGGTSVVTAVMRALPLAVPKLCVSTAAAGNTEPYVGTTNIVLMPSVVDVAGLNRISRIVFDHAAGAIGGMVAARPTEAAGDRPVIAASMFGNTTECVGECVRLLEAEGFEVLVFHATGTGGKTMEALVRDGLVDAVLDITTTELADTLCGGVFDAGPERLDAPGQVGIPHLVVPGCIDMVNFGAIDTVPERYREDRLLYEWNPSVTLMRTNVEENRALGARFAEKINAARGPVAVLVPLRGVSILDGDGERFCDREADQAMFDTLERSLRDDVPFTALDCNINDPAFAAQAVAALLRLMGEHQPERHEGETR